MLAHSDFYRGLLVGLVIFGSMFTSARCYPVQPAHAMDTDQAMLEVARAINKQTAVLERLVRATEGCK